MEDRSEEQSLGIGKPQRQDLKGGDMAKIEDILGGSPVAILVKLAIVSIVVGVILSATGLQPFDVLHGVKRLLIEFYNLGWGAVEQVLSWLLTGAVIVIPVWLLIRLLSAGSKRKS